MWAALRSLALAAIQPNRSRLRGGGPTANNETWGHPWFTVEIEWAADASSTPFTDPGSFPERRPDVTVF